MQEAIVYQTPTATAKPIAKGKVFAPLYSHEEEMFNAISHFIGGGLGVLGLIFSLILAYPNPAYMAAMAIFSMSMIVLYTMSAVYHVLPAGRAKGIFRIFDHCTIYLLIAGTYTPVCMIALGGTALGTGILIAEWAFAVVGITLNAVAMNKKFVKVLSMILYMGMGWAVAISFRPLLAAISNTSFYLILAGGLCYTVGVIFYALGKKHKNCHAVWHIFDLLGTAFQFFGVLLFL